MRALTASTYGLFHDTIWVRLLKLLNFSSFIKKHLKPISIGALLLFVVLGMVAIANPKITYAATNQDLSFEGKIVSNTGTNIADGTYNVEFTIYTGCTNEPTSSTGCSAVWKEDYLTSNTTYATTIPVTFTSGTFQVNLGSICPFTGGSCEGNVNTAINWDTSPLYASINVGTTSACAAGFTSCGGGTGAMNPYILLTASPYAMDAANADALGGIAAASFVQLSPSSQQTGNLNISGTVTSGLINGQTIAGAASFGTSVTAPSLIASTGVYTGGSGGTERLDSSGNLLSIGNITGSAAMTVQSGGSGALTLTSASGTIALGSGTLQNNGTSVTLDIANASNSTFDVTNSSGGIASVSIDAGGSYTGVGAVSLTSGGATALSLDTGGGAAINIGATNATSIVIGGNTTATIKEKVANSSATAYTLQTAGGTNLLVADTTGSRLYVGGSAGTSTPILLVLGVKNTTGDPTETDGSMYYNTTNNRYRCGENGAWVNCIGGTMFTNTAASSAVNTCTTACAAFSTSVPLPANFCVPGRMIHIVASGVFSTNTTGPTFGAWGVYLGANAATKTSDTLIGGATPTSSALTASMANQQWRIDYNLLCETAGSSGTVQGEGSFSFVPSTTTTASETTLPMNASATTTINTTTAQTLYLFPAWGTSNANNTVTLEQLIVTAQ